MRKAVGDANTASSAQPNSKIAFTRPTKWLVALAAVTPAAAVVTLAATIIDT